MIVLMLMTYNVIQGAIGQHKFVMEVKDATTLA